MMKSLVITVKNGLGVIKQDKKGALKKSSRGIALLRQGYKHGIRLEEWSLR